MATEIEPLIMPFNPLWVTTSKREYREAVRRMGEEPGDTKGNAKRALLQLLAMARMRPDGVWDGD